MSTKRKPIGAAIIGCGNISTSYAENMLKYPEVKLLGFNDIDQGRAEECAKKYGGKVYPTLDEVLADTEVEIVVNLTIFQVHAEVIRKCLEAGKHVHTEKPISMTSEESWGLVKLAEEKGLRFSSSPTVLSASRKHRTTVGSDVSVVAVKSSTMMDGPAVDCRDVNRVKTTLSKVALSAKAKGTLSNWK